ncbi:MAG TPA: hypothetical protein VD861_02965 [Pyrinomonadaceae bacterium]|nr:hypothetical protein [Pyrinomonadaceae bacterium]
MSRLIRHLEFPLAALMFLAGSAFLLKMCYLSLLQNTVFVGFFLLIFYAYLRARHRLKIPPALLLLVMAALEVDALGNYFQLYGRHFGPVMYDEFAHLAVQALTAPLILWLAREGLARVGYHLPLGLVTVFSVMALFSMSGLYEIIELWDERYFGGQRIWSTHDAPNDLQWNLAGIIIGSVSTYLVMKYFGNNVTQSPDRGARVRP